jgi:hypothetical protein
VEESGEFNKVNFSFECPLKCKIRRAVMEGEGSRERRGVHTRRENLD